MTYDVLSRNQDIRDDLTHFESFRTPVSSMSRVGKDSLNEWLHASCFSRSTYGFGEHVIVNTVTVILCYIGRSKREACDRVPGIESRWYILNIAWSCLGLVTRLLLDLLQLAFRLTLVLVLPSTCNWLEVGHPDLPRSRDTTTTPLASLHLHCQGHLSALSQTLHRFRNSPRHVRKRQLAAKHEFGTSF